MWGGSVGRGVVVDLSHHLGSSSIKLKFAFVHVLFNEKPRSIWMGAFAAAVIFATSFVYPQERSVQGLMHAATPRKSNIARPSLSIQSSLGLKPTEVPS